VEPQEEVVYSGMIPGWIARQYQWSDLSVSVSATAKRYGIQWIKAGFEFWHNGEVKLSSGQCLQAEILSLNLGSRSKSSSLAKEDDQSFLSSRPLFRFPSVLSQWDYLFAEGGRLAVIGSGAAAIECALCFQERYPEAKVHVFAHNLSAVWKKDLLSRGIILHLNHKGNWIRESNSWQLVGEEEALTFSGIFWATGAAPDLKWKETGLPTMDGYIATDQHLLVTARGENRFFVFAAGDCASLSKEKAGVYAVQQGPILAQNIVNAEQGLKQYRWKSYSRLLPPLQILNGGDGGARIHWGSWFTWKSKSIFRMKDSLDRNFMAKHQAPEGGGIA
jgi:thioredoxin reductase